LRVAQVVPIASDKFAVLVIDIAAPSVAAFSASRQQFIAGREARLARINCRRRVVAHSSNFFLPSFCGIFRSFRGIGRISILERLTNSI
jgi:hypothetical protein